MKIIRTTIERKETEADPSVTTSPYDAIASVLRYSSAVSVTVTHEDGSQSTYQRGAGEGRADVLVDR